MTCAGLVEVFISDIGFIVGKSPALSMNSSHRHSKSRELQCERPFQFDRTSHQNTISCFIPIYRKVAAIKDQFRFALG